MLGRARRCGRGGYGTACGELFEVRARQIGVEAGRIVREERVPGVDRAELPRRFECILRRHFRGFRQRAHLTPF